MKQVLSVISFFVFLDSSYCQLRLIPVTKILNLEEKALHCLNDSLNVISKSCSLGLDGFKINLYSVSLDKSNREMQIVGRVCIAKEANSPGLSDVQIFKATKEDHKLLNRSPIGETTKGTNLSNNDGFFDIKVSINKGECLFFNRTGYFLREFPLFKLWGSH